MGAWGVGTFETDVACDWAYGLEELDDLTLVEETLARAHVEPDEYLEAGDACDALAACEVIARLKGNWGQRNSYTETVDAWVESHPISPPQALVDEALRAIERILTPKSELLDLYEESESLDAWRKAVEELRPRVRG